MNVLLISVGMLLAAFSIPTDIKNLTIHTIVTKPVERFEIVLGRPPVKTEHDASLEVRRKHGPSTVCWALFNASEFLYLR